VHAPTRNGRLHIYASACEAENNIYCFPSTELLSDLIAGKLMRKVKKVTICY